MPRTSDSAAMAPAPSAGPGRTESLLVLAAVCLSLLALPFNFTGPAVAMPAIARSLGGDPIALNWITNAFMLCFGSTLMIAGALADTFGRKRLFLIGQLVFLATSTRRPS